VIETVAVVHLFHLRKLTGIEAMKGMTERAKSLRIVIVNITFSGDKQRTRFNNQKLLLLLSSLLSLLISCLLFL
ncbi:MAG: hypothetical protein ACOYK6_08935, partial [Chthoniobacterales bacterium]